VSFVALAWASKYRADSAADKLVLLAYADRHNEDTGCAYPSLAWLCEFSSLNRKTVIDAVGRLEKAGILTDTGQRAGATKQVKVYRLIMADRAALSSEVHYTYRLENDLTGEFYIGVRSFLGDPQTDSYMGSGRWPTGAAYRQEQLKKQVLCTFESRVAAERAEAALIEEAMQHPLCKNISKEYLKRHRLQTVPKTGNSTEKCLKQSQKRDPEPIRTYTPSETTFLQEEAPAEKSEKGDDPLKPEHVLEAWNDLAGRLGLSKARMTDDRRKRLRAAIRRYSLEDFGMALGAIERSQFCLGENPRGWRADFDFLLQPKSFIRLIEGSYDGQSTH
jgi:hypothetical protein